MLFCTRFACLVGLKRKTFTAKLKVKVKEEREGRLQQKRATMKVKKGKGRIGSAVKGNPSIAGNVLCIEQDRLDGLGVLGVQKR